MNRLPDMVTLVMVSLGIRFKPNKKALSNVDNAHLVENLEKCTPFIFEET